MRPYPKEWERHIKLRNGKTAFVRPVRPEDEEKFKRFFEKITPEDLRLRFFAPVRDFSHAFLARLTQLDYARAIAFVAFDDESGEMMGAVRLHADANHETGEYGILLRSDLKGLGLGWELMRLMIEWAKVEGLRVIEGQVLRENSTMLDMCRSLGFSIEIDPDDPDLRLVTLPVAAIEEPGEPVPPARRRDGPPRGGPLHASQRCEISIVVAFEPADMLLGIELDADLLDEVELGLEEVDMAFLVLHQLLEQVLGHPVSDAFAIGGRLAVQVAGIVLGRKVRLEDFLDGLADAQRVEHLQVGEAFEEDDALDERRRGASPRWIPCARSWPVPCIPNRPAPGNGASTG